MSAGLAVTLGSGWENAGAKVKITATPSSGHKLTAWTSTGTGIYAGTSTTNTMTMNSAIIETATFT